MPPFRRYYNYRHRRYRPRRRRFYRRRFRRPLQRKFRRRRWVRRRFYFKKKLRKLKSLKIRQWQPKIIKKCHIKGYKTLFQAGPDRDSNNYAQYQDTIVEEHLPGGGGWSLLLFSLDALWEEHEKDRNWWTVSNKGLPLVRYVGCTFKFFRDLDVDYAVSYELCYPMVDTPYKHANSSPFITLLAKRRFIVPSFRHKPRGKPYIKKKFHPPSQMKNKWYFQSDICKTGLLMLTTTAVDLNYFSCPPWAISNCITIKCLNPVIFKKKAFRLQQTQGYTPQPGFYYYCFAPGEHDMKVKNLHYLGGIGQRGIGKRYADNPSTYTTKVTDWGNIFTPEVLQLDIPVFKTTVQISQVFNTSNLDTTVQEHVNTTITGGTITPVTVPFITTLRYNPHRDTGQNNTIYITSIETEENGFKPPTDENLKIQGFPLWLGLWGWLDWQKKAHWVSHIDASYLCVIESKFTEPELTHFVPIDQSFLDGNGPYNIPEKELSDYTLSTWYPKVANQLVTINSICHSGPGTQKYKNLKQIQAHCFYNFTVKWGGCPAPSVDLTNPCSQPKYTVPDNLVQRLQNQDPKTPPELELHDFDERRQQITTKCIKRIQAYTKTEQTLSPIAGTTDPPTKTKRQKIQEALQASPEKKEQATLQQQLLQQQQQQHLLRRAILKLMGPNIE